ncbi:MAG TPA: CDP-alcohol phosphatidyltransferase family protein [Acidimicrobiales bacterium]|nr:CDP-alcohol phosphatidyltransferase family protein [Acidimicrobiales bacterium]
MEVPVPVSHRYARTARVTPANAITMTRMLAAPVMVAMIAALGPSWWCLATWVALASTDFLDGWVARREGPTSSGAFLDPLADKALVLGALVALAATGLVGWLPVVLVAGREAAMSVWRSQLARRGVSVPARPLAKVKTATQDLAIGLLLVPAIGRHHPDVGRAVLWVAVVLALASFAQYLRDGRPARPGGRRAG